ncbi:MAG TPA: helix-turn-helix domain-containing protein [Ktedonobacteraceae bacterium]|jgi:transcriptional regulator with XRE-family HTH domain
MNKPPRRNEFLRQARREQNWTQSDLAEKLDVGKQTVQSWELGTRIPSLQFRRRLCDLFSKTPQQLGLQLDSKDEQISQQLSLSPPLLDTAALPFLPENGRVDGETAPSLQEIARRRVTNRGDENRQRMLRRVRFYWITGVLERSLYHATLITLGLQEQPGAIEPPWRLAVAELDLPPRPLPAGTRITQVYDEADGELLILGEPGAGKTSLLLELARDLLDRAEYDQSHPIPVIFPLSSWAIKQPPLADWLAEELHTKYRVPLKIGQEWIETNHLLVLLDGLDEVTEVARSACIKAINAYQQAHGLVPIVVCCRRGEYFMQATRVALRRAVLVQPLTGQQIDKCLCGAGEQLEAVRKALDADPELQEMVKTPLMLSIVSLAYQGEASTTDVPAGSIEARRRQIFATYVQRMLTRRGAETCYSEEQAISWLAWLAYQLVHHSQLEFYLERIQPDWVPDSQRHRKGIVRLIYGMECAMIAGLLGWIHGGKVGNTNGVGAGLLGWLGSGPGNRVLGWMAPGLGRGVEGEGMFGLILGVVFVLVIVLIDGSSPAEVQWSWAPIQQSVAHGLLNGVRSGCIIGGLCSILFLVISGNLGSALSFGAQFGFLTGTIIGFLSALVVSKRDHSVALTFVDHVIDGLVIGVCGGLGFGIINGLLVGADQGFMNGLIIGLASCVAFGFGGGISLIRDLGSEIKPAETTSWSWQSVRNHLVGNLFKGLMIGLSVTLIVGMITGMASSLFYDPAYGWVHGLVYGPIVGSIATIASLLTGILNSGWSSDILDERQLVRPNEGIRRSAYNSLLAALLFGPFGGIVSGIVSGLSFGLIGRLTGWRVLGTGFAIVFGIIFTFEFLMLRGGIACIGHYVLRWRLWRLGSIPWRYVRFLDYAAEHILLRKVGGGYLFVHSMLLEYFASLYPSEQGKGPFPQDAGEERPGNHMQQAT